MKRFFFLGYFFGSSSSFAQEMGTKSDIAIPAPSNFSGISSVWPLFQLILVFGLVVLGLKFLLPRLVPMVNRKLSPSLGSRIKIEESATFAGGSLYVVSVDGQSTLICVSTTGVQTLMELKKSHQQDPPAFFEMVDQSKQRPIAQAAVMMPEEADWSQPAAQPPMSREQAELALSRLKRLLR